MNATETRRTEAGLCPRCGERPPAPDRKACRPCLDYETARQTERNHRRRGAPRRPHRCSICGAAGHDARRCLARRP